MRAEILKFILIFQGLYYSLTGLWAFFGLESFSRLTGHFGDPFEMRSIAAIAVVLGMAFLAGAYWKEYLKFAAFLVLGSAVAVIIPEVIYFSEIKDTLFIWDLFEEIGVALLVGISLRLLPFRDVEGNHR